MSWFQILVNGMIPFMDQPDQNLPILGSLLQWRWQWASIGHFVFLLVPWQLQTFCPHPEWQQWEAASSEEAGIHHNSHIYPLGNGYWVVWEDMPKKKHFSFVHWKKGQWAWFLVIFNTKIIKSTKIMITIITHIIVVIIVTWFCNMR